jgi:hypothetical protein
MAGRKRQALAADLSRAAERFEQWRRTRDREAAEEARRLRTSSASSIQASPTRLTVTRDAMNCFALAVSCQLYRTPKTMADSDSERISVSCTSIVTSWQMKRFCMGRRIWAARRGVKWARNPMTSRFWHAVSSDWVSVFTASSAGDGPVMRTRSSARAERGRRSAEASGTRIVAKTEKVRFFMFLPPVRSTRPPTGSLTHRASGRWRTEASIRKATTGPGTAQKYFLSRFPRLRRIA